MSLRLNASASMLFGATIDSVKTDMKRFRLLQMLRAIWTRHGHPAAELPVKLIYPRGHRIRRDLVTAVCHNRMHILRLMTRGDCEVINLTPEQWRDYVIKVAASQGVRVIRAPWNAAPGRDETGIQIGVQTGVQIETGLADLPTPSGSVTR